MMAGLQQHWKSLSYQHNIPFILIVYIQHCSKIVFKMSKHKKVEKCSCSWRKHVMKFKKKYMEIFMTCENNPMFKLERMTLRKTKSLYQWLKGTLVLKVIAIILSRLLHTIFNFHHWNITTNAKTLQWPGPLSVKEATRFKNSTSKIYLHPDSMETEHLFYQTPNMPKQELLWKLKQWSSERKKHKLEMKHVSVTPPVSNDEDFKLNQSNVSQIEDSLPQETNCLLFTPTTCKWFSNSTTITFIQ